MVERYPEKVSVVGSNPTGTTMIPSFVVYGEASKLIGVFYVMEEAIRCIQLGNQRKIEGADKWHYEEVPLCNNADKFIEALIQWGVAQR